MNQIPNSILINMNPWFEGRYAYDVRNRTVEQMAWDSAILAASEYVRRRTNNEDFALEIHEMLSTKIPHGTRH